MHTPHLTIAALAAASLILAACSGGSDDPTAADGSSTSAVSTAEATTTSSTGDETTSTSSSSSTSSVETTTTTAATTTTETEDEYALGLSPEGLLVVEKSSGSTNPLTFGSGQTIVLGAVTDLLGPPSELGPGSDECGNGQDFVAVWDNQIMLEFSQSSFIAWSLRTGSTLTDLTGIGLGSSLSTVQSDWQVTVEESTLGTEFATSGDGTGYGGLLGVTDVETVEQLWAGPVCVFR